MDCCTDSRLFLFVLRPAPQVRVPFLRLMGALASSERGVHLVLRQMDAMGQVPGRWQGRRGGEVLRGQAHEVAGRRRARYGEGQV